MASYYTVIAFQFLSLICTFEDITFEDVTHRNAVTTRVKRVAWMSCPTELEKKEVLQADLERNVSLCLHNSFCRDREQTCCKPGCNSVDMLQKVLDDSEMVEQEPEATK